MREQEPLLIRVDRETAVAFAGRGPEHFKAEGVMRGLTQAALRDTRRYRCPEEAYGNCPHAPGYEA